MSLSYETPNLKDPSPQCTPQGTLPPPGTKFDPCAFPSVQPYPGIKQCDVVRVHRRLVWLRFLCAFTPAALEVGFCALHSCLPSCCPEHTTTIQCP